MSAAVAHTSWLTAKPYSLYSGVQTALHPALTSRREAAFAQPHHTHLSVVDLTVAVRIDVCDDLINARLVHTLCTQDLSQLLAADHAVAVGIKRLERRPEPIFPLQLALVDCGSQELLSTR